MQPSFITSEMYRNGQRIESAKTITFNPFYHAGFDRAKATSYVSMFNEPVLRPSSIPTRFALTFRNASGSISHSLIKQNADLSVDQISETGVVMVCHRNIFALLDEVLGLAPREEEIAHQPLPRAIVAQMESRGETVPVELSSFRTVHASEDPIEPRDVPIVAPSAAAGGAGASATFGSASSPSSSP